MNRRPSSFFLYKYTEARVRALRFGGYGSYTLSGLLELRDEGFSVEAGWFGEPNRFRGWIAAILRRICVRRTGYCGNFRQTMAGLSEIRRAKALVLTSNNAAFPVLFLRSLGLSIPPVLVISVGLEWNPPNDSPRRLRSISKLFRHAEKILVYSESEREFLMERIGIEPHRILAVPFGIPRKYLPAALPPMTSDEEGEVFQWDVISVGADAQRDLPLLLEWARNNPEMRVHLILGDDLVREYTDLLASVTVESNLSVEEVFERIRSSRGAVVPVRENLYSAGTTFLIHALACQTPALVSQTSCLGPQYRISESGCFTYSPGDTEDFSQGMKKLLALSTNERRSRGEQGRRWVETYADGKPALGVLREFLEAHSSSPAKEQN